MTMGLTVPAAGPRGRLTRRPLGLLALAALVTLLAAEVNAQAWRTVSSSRQARSADAIAVRIVHAAGTATVEPADGTVLYRMDLRYDAERVSPVSAFDEAARTLTIGTRTASTAKWKSGRHEGNTLRAGLGRGVPLDLTVELGAVRADLFLGGLRIRELELRAGASEVHVDVDRPNADAASTVDVDVGAAQLVLRRGGNLRSPRVRANVGAGKLDYDLGGEWTGTIDLTANVAIGELILRVPPDVGLRVSARTYAASFDRAGLVRDGDEWVSPGFRDASRRAIVRVTTVLGGFEIVRR